MNKFISRVPGHVTVVIPTYNRAHFLSQTIAGVFAQTYDRWDIIVVDDGSTDNTKDVVAGFPKQVTYLAMKHSGYPAVARNAGIRRAKGEFIAFLDSDDLWLPHKLAAQVSLLKQHPTAGLTCADAYLFNEDRRDPKVTIWAGRVPPAGNVFGELYRWNFIHTSSVMLRRHCLDNVGVFDERPAFIVAQDYHLWLRVAARYGVIPIDDPLVNYRLHGKRHCENQKDRVSRAVLTVLLDIKQSHPDLASNAGDIVNRRLSEMYEIIGREEIKKGRLIDAWSAFERCAAYGGHSARQPAVRGLIGFGSMAAKSLKARLETR